MIESMDWIMMIDETAEYRGYGCNIGHWVDGASLHGEWLAYPGAFISCSALHKLS